jgi:ubiquinone biosynthesis protein
VTETDPLDRSQVEGRLLGRAAQIARVLARHGLGSRRGTTDGDSARERARRLRSTLEELGPTFSKLGQIVSTRPDLLSEEFIEELATLQDHVPPMREAEVVSVMEEELGVPWEDVFGSIEPEPLAAGTIGQVHRATLEGGDRVVVKVQRPTAAGEILRDLGLLELFAEKVAARAGLRELLDIPAVVAHLSASLRRELDFRQEAANIERLREVIAPYPRLAVPRLYAELSTARLLVMEEVQGVPVRQAPEGEARTEAARQLLEAYYRQILTAGFFHADPHPGNMLWWNERIYFLDLGMVGEVEPELRELMLLLLLAFVREDAGFLSEVILMLSGEEQRSDLDLARLEEDFAGFIARFRAGSLKDIQLGPMLEGLVQIAASHGVRLPASLALCGKAFGQMQLAAAELDPTLDPFGVVGSFVLRGVTERVRERSDPYALYYDAQKLRLRLTRLVEAVERVIGARPGSKLQVELRGTTPLEDAIRGAGRRIALAFASGAALVATGVAAASADVPVGILAALACAAGGLTTGLAVDLLRRR